MDENEEEGQEIMGHVMWSLAVFPRGGGVGLSWTPWLKNPS